MMKILKNSQANVTAYLKFVCNEYLVNIDFNEDQTHFVISKQNPTSGFFGFFFCSLLSWIKIFNLKGTQGASF